MTVIKHGRWCKEHINRSIQHLHETGFGRNMDFYEFGVYRGETLQLIENLFYSYQIPVRQGWGFDSFEGLPEEAPGVDRFYLFQKGMFSDVNFMWPTRQVKFVKGWFSDLKDEHVAQHGMRPANFVHIDSDLYVSACQALDFMFRNKLIVPGTVVGYDEFKSTQPLLAGGEAKAHVEIAEKYGVRFHELFRNVYHDNIECWQNAFVVEGFGQPQAGIHGV